MGRELPYFRWYPKDAESDEKYSAMTDEELGFFHRCLNKAWENDGLPADPVRRALIMRTPQDVADRLWQPDCWVPHRFDSTRVANPRQESERKEAMRLSKVRAKAGSVGGKASAKVKQLLEPSLSIPQVRAYGSVSVSESVSKKKNSFQLSGEELDSAWERHLKHSRDEPRDMVFQILIGMEGFDPEKFRERHPQYCSVWSGRWQYCPLTFLGWIRAGMPFADVPKDRETRDQRIARELEEEASQGL